MKMTIKGSDPLDMVLFEDDEVQDIIQNILCILNTTKGSCPNLRDYGLDPDILHKPMPIAKSAYAVAISEQMRQYETRATLLRVTFEDDSQNPSSLIPILEVSIP